MKKVLTVLFAVLISLTVCACSPSEEAAEVSQPLPELLKGQTFVSDELETGEGNSLYTLSFTDTAYTLYQDNGVGILAEGNAEADDGRTLTLTYGNTTLAGKYAGGVFESTSVSLDYGGKQMVFVPATDTAEYVYLSYLGV